MKFISITPENNNTNEFMEVTNEMPAFVKLYSPGCGHCIAMQDAWDALKGNAALTNYEMAVIEVHADELDKIKSPAMSVNQGFPTVRKVLKNGNVGKDYEGNRTTADMIKFIKENFAETLNKGNNKKSQTHIHKMKGGKKSRKSKKGKQTRKTKKSKKSKKSHRKTYRKH